MAAVSKFLPSLGTTQRIDAAYQVGRGAAAAVLGQTYDVYRLGPTTQNAVISGTPALVNFPCRLRRTLNKVMLENVTFDLLCFEATCDNRPLQLGDVLVENGYKADQDGQYVVAQYRPTRETIVVRVEANSAIQRPYPFGGAASQQPSPPVGAVALSGYGGTSQFNREAIVLVDGMYDWASFDDATPLASIPVGIQQTNRVSPGRDPKLPTVIAESRFIAFVPLLPGVEIEETAVIKAQHGDNYEVLSVYTSEGTGLEGYTLIVRKLAN